MEQTFEGTIISEQLGTFGKNDIIYGYIGIKTTKGKQKKIKIDSYTSYETLDMGSEVIIEAAELGDTGILVARKISVNPKVTHTSEEYSAAST